MTDLEELQRDILQDLMNSSTEYCCYCGQARYKFGCCGEVHYETFADLSEEDQKYILDETVADELERLAKQ